MLILLSDCSIYKIIVDVELFNDEVPFGKLSLLCLLLELNVQSKFHFSFIFHTRFSFLDSSINILIDKKNKEYPIRKCCDLEVALKLII